MPLRDGLRFLRDSDDTLFHPDTIRTPKAPVSVGELTYRVREGTPSVCLASLWELAEKGPAAAEAVEAVAGCLDDEDPFLVAEAARTLGALGPAAAPTLPRLLKALRTGGAQVRAGVASALGRVGLEPDATVPQLTLLLADSSPAVVPEAARSLGAFGLRAGPALPELLDALRKLLIECDGPAAEVLLGALAAVASDPHRELEDYFADDAELCQQALEALDRGRQREEDEFEDT